MAMGDHTATTPATAAEDPSKADPKANDGGRERDEASP